MTKQEEKLLLEAIEKCKENIEQIFDRHNEYMRNIIENIRNENNN